MKTAVVNVNPVMSRDPVRDNRSAVARAVKGCRVVKMSRCSVAVDDTCSTIRGLPLHCKLGVKVAVACTSAKVAAPAVSEWKTVCLDTIQQAALLMLSWH